MPGSPRSVVPITLAALVAWSGVVATDPTWAGTCPEVVGPAQELSDRVSGGPCGGHDHAQTFTVTVAGRLEAVEFFGCGSTGDPILPGHVLLADLRPVVNGIPVESNSSVLALVEIPRSQFPSGYCEWRRIDFGDQGPLVQPGQSLALVLRVNDNFCIGWRGRFEYVPGDAYPGGRFYSRPAGATWFTADGLPDIVGGPKNYDMAFRVITCEPAVPVRPTTWGRLKIRYD